MSRRKHITIALLGMILLLAGCAPVQVSQDYREEVAFSRYHTYGWKEPATAPAANVRVDNPLLHERFHRAINDDLALRGYTLKEPPDFLVGYEYSIESRVESEPYGPRLGVGFGRFHRYDDWDFDDDFYYGVDQYYVGILAIDFYDTQSGKLIWRGIGSARVDLHATPKETTAFVDRLVKAVLDQFPPRPGAKK